MKENKPDLEEAIRHINFVAGALEVISNELKKISNELSNLHENGETHG